MYCVDIKFTLKKGLKFYQTRWNAIISLRNTPNFLYPDSASDGKWRSHTRKSICVTSTSWMKELGSEVARQPEGEVARQQKNSQSTQPNPNHDRTVRSVVCSQSERSMLNEVDIDFRIPGLPHSVVKQSLNSRVREIVKKTREPFTLIDKLLNMIYNQIMPTINSVKSPRRWLGTCVM